MENINQPADGMIAEETEAAAAEETAGVQGEDRQESERKYTDADVDRIIAKKIAAERKRLSRLFADGQQVAEIEERERNVQLRELKADAKDALISRDLPLGLSELLNYNSKEEMEQSLERVAAVFNNAVHQGLKDKLRCEVPTRGAATSSKEIDREKALRDAFAPKKQGI